MRPFFDCFLAKSVLLQFTLFCRETCFVAVYAFSVWRQCTAKMLFVEKKWKVSCMGSPDQQLPHGEGLEKTRSNQFKKCRCVQFLVKVLVDFWKEVILDTFFQNGLCKRCSWFASTRCCHLYLSLKRRWSSACRCSRRFRSCKAVRRKMLS